MATKRHPSDNTPTQAELDMKEIRFSLIPMHSIRLVGYVKALSNVGNLKKGQVYSALFVTDKGQMGIRGDLDRTYPMSAFSHPETPMALNLLENDSAE